MDKDKSGLLLRIFLGSMVIMLGVGLILEQLEIVQFWNLFGMWWPSVLIIFAIAQFITSPRQFLSALFVLLIGAVFLIDNLNLFPISGGAIVFPTILIVVGLRVLLGSFISKAQSKSAGDYANAFALFGASEVVSTSSTLKGGTITALFGGASADLRGAKLSGGEASIDLNVAFGGADIIVPKDWEIKVNTLPIFGGVGNKTVQTGAKGGVLNVRGLVMFGGVEVKNEKE